MKALQETFKSDRQIFKTNRHCNLELEKKKISLFLRKEKSI